MGTSSWFPRVLIQNLEYAVHDSSKEIVTSGNEERFSTFIATLNEGLAENRIIREDVARASDAVNFEKKFSFRQGHARIEVPSRFRVGDGTSVH